MLKPTIDLMKEHGGLITAGFFLYFFSVFGQSIFFGVYLPHFQEELELSKTTLGSLYMFATIASSIVIIFSGKMLDHYPLRNFIACTFVGLAAGCFVIANAYNAIMLLIAFFLLRQFGQGLMVLSANTSINRYLDKNRGKAVALISLGVSAQFMIFPPMAIMAEDYIGWRTAWMIYGCFALFILLPSFWLYLKHHQSTTHARWETRVKAESEKAVEAVSKEWTRKTVLQDPRFYALAAITILSPYVGTAIAFYQREIAASLSIDPLTFAGTFTFFSLMSVVLSFAAGGVIDKYSEKPVLIAYPLIFALGLYLLTSGFSLPVTYLGMALVGGASGMMMTLGGPLLASLYGTKHLGSIKSLFFSMAILASALSPFTFGLLMDMGYDVLDQLAAMMIYAGLVWILAFPVCKNLKHCEAA